MSTQSGKRRNTSLESEGAEFLVLAHLLIEGIQTIKAYTRFPGYDLIATDPDAGTSCRIQVKSRWATDHGNGFPLKNFETDFVVFAALNRGYQPPRATGSGKRPPDLYVFPIEVLVPVVKSSGGWSKVNLRHVDNLDRYRDDWAAIRAFLARAG